ncbi:BIR protein [Plasmodium berghei ANKA]|uniref:BIR protein n=1 Tax=Plasmodium berghei (strain Anka) TaxID=5823 RepID=A0A509AHY6_PLABA|nr:BIR protein [Plasmodium berghei ANKA]VUC54228.1 BIR protein [Plasmodium berghei ANKA]|eukprot:XP_034420064.1 BIR protein [Plasmodium berghei ANKA]
MPKETCTIFQNANNLFNEGKLDFDTINLKNGPYIQYCPYHRESKKYECKNIYDGLNALCMHLFTELYKIPGEVMKFKSNNKQYVGYIMMWLSYRLSQITDYNDSTLFHFYENYLKNAFINYEHMDKITKNKYLKDASIEYMSQLYNLFNEICNLTLKYSRNPTDTNQIIVSYNKIYNIHKNIYNDIKECDSYLYLLNTLKTEYEKFKKNITKNGRRDLISGQLYASVKNLIPTRELGKYYKSGFGFEECIRANSKVKKQFPDPAPNAPKDQKPKPSSKQNQPSKPRTTITKPVQNGISRPSPASFSKPSGVPSPPPPLPSYQPKDNEPETPPAPRVLPIISLSSQTSTELQKTATEESNHKIGQESSKIKPNVSDNSERHAGGTIVDKGSSSSGSIKHGGESSDQGSGKGLRDSPSIITNETGTHTDKKIVVDGNKAEGNSKVNEQKDSMGNTGSKKSPSGNTIDSNNHLSTSGTNQGDSNDELVDGPKGSTVREGDTGNRSLNTGGGQNEKNISGGEPDGGQGSRGGSEGSEDSGGGSSSEPGVTDNVPEEKETKSTSGTFFNIRPDIFKITLKGMDQLNNTFKFFRTYKEKIINISNEIHGVYNTTLDIIKNSFDKSINVFNKIIENISFDSKKIEITDDSGDKKHGSDGTGDKSPTSDDSPPIQGDSTQRNPTQENSNQISLTPSSNEQTRETKSSQDTPENKNYKSSREEPQKPVPAPVIKLKNSVTEVKENGTTGIDVNILKKYKPIGILIIALLAPITLLIVYKYFSFGWRKELKRKQNMKKVIKLFGGNKTTKKVINSTNGKKQMQIIINSSEHKKQTKKSINYVYRGKSPLLNIYNHVQVNPAPFINLFFLLIFFVYKRKKNSLE